MQHLANSDSNHYQPVGYNYEVGQGSIYATHYQIICLYRPGVKFETVSPKLSNYSPDLDNYYRVFPSAYK